MAEKKEAPPTAKVRHADKRATSFSFDGETYEAGKDGTFVVPEHALTELASHGFEHVTD